MFSQALAYSTIHCFLRHVDRPAPQSGSETTHALAYLPLPNGQTPVALGQLYVTMPPKELEKAPRDSRSVPPRDVPVDVSPYILRGPVGICRMCHAVHCTLTKEERAEASISRMLGKRCAHYMPTCSLGQYFAP